MHKSDGFIRIEGLSKVSATAWKRHQTHLQGRPSGTLTSSRSAVGSVTYALENPSCPGVGRSKRRDLALRRSQLGVSSNRGRLPTSLVVSFVRIGKSSAKARRSNPKRKGSGTMAHADLGGFDVPNGGPITARGPGVPQFGDGLQAAWPSKASATSWQPPCYHPAFFPPHRTFTQAEVWCGGKNAARLSRQTLKHQLAKTRLSSKTSPLRKR
jgi:hypothetical protein